MDFEKRIDENYSYLTATDRLMVQEIRQNKELVRNMNSTQPVSYTHLTLPTKLEV